MQEGKSENNGGYFRRVGGTGHGVILQRSLRGVLTSTLPAIAKTQWRNQPHEIDMDKTLKMPPAGMHKRSFEQPKCGALTRYYVDKQVNHENNYI
ncbi:hypothetical protein Pfra02_16440 [Pseudomonas fragi]|nr:hypothetical protein Pfra02_16440 [Pseudomonas fragi]